MRDDFDKRVKQVLAARVGFRCSNPDCRAGTTGPVTDPHRSSNIGEAAHITAASPGGPRFDAATPCTSVISAVGFEPHHVWTALKGVPAAYTVTKVGGYTVEVTSIVPDQRQMLELDDPVALPPAGTGRISLRLSRFREHLPGNECLLRLCVVANGELWRSRLVYLGVY